MTPKPEPLGEPLAELQGLLHTLCESSATQRDMTRLETIIVSNPEACTYYIRYMQLHGALYLNAMPLCAKPGLFDGVPTLAKVNGSHASAPHAGTQHNRVRAESPSPATSSFMNRLLHMNNETPMGSALMWLTMALLCSGMVLSVFLCLVLVFREVGAGHHADSQQAAGNPSPALKGAPEKAVPETLGPDKGEWGGSDPVASSRGGNSRSDSAPPTASVARLIHATDCRWAADSHGPALDEDLAPGRRLMLRSGVAELMFQTGVRALLEGPATLEILSNHSTRLHYGKVTVCVEDPDALGFQVRTPAMKYTDLGTEFGVSVAKDGTETMVVFRGQVRAEAAPERRNDESDSAAARRADVAGGRPNSLILSANEAVCVAGPQKRVVRVTPDKKMFVRAKPKMEPFALFGTGIGLNRGAADPHWEITEISTMANFKPRLAVVVVPEDNYARDNRDKAQWISSSEPKDNMPKGCRWTLRTHFGLTGFDASTARIDGRITADNYVMEIRVNGKAVPVPPGNRDETLLERWLPLEIRDGFAPGDNTLEIVIENDESESPDHSSPMGLCAELTGSARPLPKLDDDE